MSCNQDNSYIAAKMLINTIQNKEKEFSLFKICEDIKCMMSWNFNFKEFRDAVYKLPDIKIETLWNLHILQVLPFDVSLTRFRSEIAFNEFLQNICSLFLIDVEDKALEFIQLGLISYLLNKAFNGAGEDNEKVCLSIIQSFLKEFFSLKKEDILKKRTNIFFSIWKCGLIENAVLYEFCIYSLHQFLKNQNGTIMEAFVIQEHCRSHNEPFHMIFVIEKIIKSLTSDDVVSILFKSDLEKTSNWINYVVLLETFLRTDKFGPKNILRNNEELIQRSFQHFNQNGLKKAIIIGRQIALQSEESFPMAYKQWFMNQFGDSSYIKNSQTFSFLIEVLSELVPYERNIEIIKVFLERPLTITSDCQLIYSDYTALLKTRIKDLEPQIQPEDVISKLLIVYEDTRKIPSYIMEAR